MQRPDMVPANDSMQTAVILLSLTIALLPAMISNLPTAACRYQVQHVTHCGCVPIMSDRLRQEDVVASYKDQKRTARIKAGDQNWRAYIQLHISSYKLNH